MQTNPILLVEDIDPAFGHWLAGFVDGEGCFAITRLGGHRRSHSLRCVFRLALRNDDAPILQEIHALLRIGSCVANRKTKDGCPQVVWDVQSKHGCLTLVRLFRRFPLRAKKARDFMIWAEAVEAWQTATYPGGRLDQQNYRPLIEARAKLIATRAYPDDGVPLVVLPAPGPEHVQLDLMRAAGIDPADLADVSGHSVSTATAHYTHALRKSHDEIRRAVG